MRPPVKGGDDADSPATEAVLVSDVIPATRERIFSAWMDSAQHSAFTGDVAVIEPAVGGKHSSFDGYASGTTMALEPFRRIVQSWRSQDFPKDSADSLLEITLEETVGGTLLTLLHTEIPTGHSDRYRDGWLRFYLDPLKRFFTGRMSNGVHPADTKALSTPSRSVRAPVRASVGRAGKTAARAGTHKAHSATSARKAVRAGGKPGRKSVGQLTARSNAAAKPSKTKGATATRKATRPATPVKKAKAAAKPARKAASKKKTTRKTAATASKPTPRKRPRVVATRRAPTRRPKR